MSAPPAARSALPTAAAVSILVLLLGAAGLFALYYTNRQTNAAFEQLSRLHAAQIDAALAQVQFKTQVQEWKNVLLRGGDEKDRADYEARFFAREADVRSALERARGALAAAGEAGDAAIAQIAADHQTLGERYRAALRGVDWSRVTAPMEIDRKVRGMDRPLNEAIDRLAGQVAQTADAALGRYWNDSARHYEKLRQVSVALAGLAILGAFALVWQVLPRRA